MTFPPSEVRFRTLWCTVKKITDTIYIFWKTKERIECMLLPKNSVFLVSQIRSWLLVNWPLKAENGKFWALEFDPEKTKAFVFFAKLFLNTERNIKTHSAVLNKFVAIGPKNKKWNQHTLVTRHDIKKKLTSNEYNLFIKVSNFNKTPENWRINLQRTKIHIQTLIFYIRVKIFLLCSYR